MFRSIALAVLFASSLSCATSGSSPSDDDLYMFSDDVLVFHYKSPPRCPYEEVARLTYDSVETEPYSTEDWQERLERRDRSKAEARQTFSESGAEAVLEGRPPTITSFASPTRTAASRSTANRGHQDFD